MCQPDYAAIWSAQMARCTSLDCYQDPAVAKKYDASKAIWEDGQRRAADLPVNSKTTVLDIGCGPGVLAIPLAETARAVTVVEPSAAMLSILQQRLAKREITNVTAHHSSWEDASLSDLGRFDIVIASYSLMMCNLRDAIIKMTEAADEWVYLFWFCGETTWDKIAIDLFPEIYGRPATINPKTDVIYGILSQLGISPDVKHLTGTSFDRHFPDHATALTDLRNRLDIETNEWDDLLAHYLCDGGVYVEDANGWRYRDQTNYVRISWAAR